MHRCSDFRTVWIFCIFVGVQKPEMEKCKFEERRNIVMAYGKNVKTIKEIRERSEMAVLLDTIHMCVHKSKALWSDQSHVMCAENEWQIVHSHYSRVFWLSFLLQLLQKERRDREGERERKSKKDENLMRVGSVRFHPYTYIVINRYILVFSDIPRTIPSEVVLTRNRLLIGISFTQCTMVNWNDIKSNGESSLSSWLTF